MRLPQLSTQVVLGVGLLLVAAAGGSLAVVLTDSPSHPSTSVRQEQPSETPTPEPSPTASETPPERTATPSATPSRTASLTPSPTHTAVATPTRSARPTPSPTCGSIASPCPGVPEGVTVSIDGPLTVVQGREYTYTLHVTWTKERPKITGLSYGSPANLPANNGCDRPTSPPPHIGPGSYTVTEQHTWESTNPYQYVTGVGETACQYYEGSDRQQEHVSVSPAPSPSAT